MSKPSSFTSYVAGLPVGKEVTVHLHGGQVIQGEIVENVASNNHETISIGNRYIGGTVANLTLIRLCDVSAVSLSK